MKGFCGQTDALKIAMIGHKRIPSREGGIEIVVENLSVRLVRLGHTVHAYNRKGGHISGKRFNNTGTEVKKEYEGVKIRTIPTFQNSRLNAMVYSLLATVNALFQHYDCIHYHAEGPSAMLWLPHIFGIRTVATIHGLDWQRSKWGGIASGYLKFGEKIAVRYADSVIVLSKNIQNYFAKTYGRDTVFIPNGIEGPVMKDPELINRRWGLVKDGYILFLGRIVPEKGVHYLIDAFRAMDTLKKLVIAGGSSHTDCYMEEVKRKAAVDDRIIFTDFVQDEELEGLYSNAYVYVLPSDLEGMPISLLEAMSYGSCCIISDIPECTEVVEDKAVVFKKGDVTDLKEKLTWLIDNPEVVDGYRAGARDFICGKYNWEEVVEKTLELYRRGDKNELSAKSAAKGCKSC